MSKKKINRRRLTSMIGVGGVMVIVFVLLRPLVNKQNETVCKNIQVNIQGDSYLIEKTEIINSISETAPSCLGSSIEQIPIDVIEQRLNTHPFIKKADLFWDINGVLMVKILQREPILRIIPSSEFKSFYIDKEGQKMPLSTSFTPRVLVANGYIRERSVDKDTLKSSVVNDLFKIASYINQKGKEFWKSQIEQVYVNEDQEIELIPRVGNHKILLGDAHRLDEKLNRLLVFYQQALPKVGWDTYKQINIKYSNQVIGVRD